jgi:hypothetical protein
MYAQYVKDRFRSLGDVAITLDLIRILLTILMFSFSVAPASLAMAQEKARDVQVDLTAEERAFLADKQSRPGVDVARPPFEYLDEEGAYT